LQSGVEKLLAWLGIERATLDPSSQSGAYDPIASIELSENDTW